MNLRVEAFVQAVEVWVPDGEGLRLASGAYGDHTEFARVSARKTFQKNEGLPGKVLSTRRPEIWKELGALFVRAELARAAGIEAAVGFPVFRGEELTAVVVFLCGRRSRTAGCIELWEVDAPNGRIVHAGGYYGTLSKFEMVSSTLQFERGCGLPGTVWQRGEPIVIDNLQNPNHFSRASLARECGLEAGFGLPIHRGSEVAHVLVMLSAQATPLVRSFETWVLEGDELRLGRSLGARASEKDELVRGAASEFGEAFIERLVKSPVPLVFERRRARSLHYDAPEAGSEIDLGVGIPVHDGERVRAAAVLLT